MEWSLLSVLPAEARTAVISTSRRRRFRRGDLVLDEGEAGQSLHLVHTGHFAVRVADESGASATLRVLGPGDAFGELSLVHVHADGSHGATVTALEPSETLCVDSRRLKSFGNHNGAIDQLLVHLLSERVEQLNERLLEALFVSVDKRVYRRLVDLAALYRSGAGAICITLTQDDIASMAGATRPTVNQVLRRLAEGGTLELHRGAITVHDLDRLRLRAV